MDESFWNAVNERLDNPYTPAKRIALDAGDPLPIEQYDLIRWETSYKHCGYVIGEGHIVAGNHEIPAYEVWNPLTLKREHLIKAQSVLWGYPESRINGTQRA